MSLNDLGNVPAGITLYLFWTSHDGATGANEAASNLAVGDILIYKNGSVTQRSSTNGFTLLDTDGIDFDGLTGVNGVSIDLSDNSDSGFYSVGGWYNVILGPITIDGQTVYINLATFRIVAAENSAGTPVADTTRVAGTTQTAADLAGLIGALNTAAATGDPGTTTTLVGYIKQLVNILIGSAGIATWPSSAAPANGVSMAEALRAVYDDSNELQGDWTNGGRLDLLIDAIKAVTDLLTAAQSEPTGVPAANETPLEKLGFIFEALRNKVTVTSTKKTFFDDADAAQWEKDLSDDGTTYTESEGNAI